MNSSKHHVQIDIFAEGGMILWTPAGPKHCFNGREAGQLLDMIAKDCEEGFDIRQKPAAIHYTTETAAEFLARGGKINHIPPAEKSKRQEVNAGLTLEDLGL